MNWFRIIRIALPLREVAARPIGILPLSDAPRRLLNVAFWRNQREIPHLCGRHDEPVEWIVMVLRQGCQRFNLLRFQGKQLDAIGCH
jgi:hypothetical protein